MQNVLQLPDLAKLDDWPEEDSDSSVTTRDSARKLLSFVMALAVKDQATSVHYQTSRDDATGDGTLSYVVGGVRYEMVPPPVEIAGAIIAQARVLLLSRGLWGSLRRLLGRASGGCSGQFTLLDPDGSRSEWCGVVWSAGITAGLEFYRLSAINVTVATI